MGKITEYHIVRSDDPENFVSGINKLIKDGWQPFGSVVTTVYYVNDKGAMVKEQPSAIVKILNTQALVKYVSVKVSDVKVVEQ